MNESTSADVVLAEVVVRLVRRASGEEGVFVAHDTSRPVLMIGLLEDGIGAVKKHHIALEKSQGPVVQAAPADLLGRLRPGPNGR